MYQGVGNMKLIKVVIEDNEVTTRIVDIPNYCRFLKNNKKESVCNDNGKRKGDFKGNEVEGC
jgi:hypothetical protein